MKFILDVRKTETARKLSTQSTAKTNLSGAVVLGQVARLTRGGPDGQWTDGNTGTNPMRFKK